MKSFVIVLLFNFRTQTISRKAAVRERGGTIMTSKSQHN